MNAIDHKDYHPSQTNDQDITEKDISIKRKKGVLYSRKPVDIYPILEH